MSTAWLKALRESLVGTTYTESHRSVEDEADAKPGEP